MRTAVLVLILFIALLAKDGHAEALYDDDAILKVTFSAPLQAIAFDKDNPERPYFDGTLSFADPVNGNVILNVRTRARGNWRRKHCRQVPLQLDFKKSEVPTTYFRQQNKLKMVRPCKSGKRASDWVMLEYLGYRVWQTVSDYHFRTRLLDVTFVDTDRDGRSSNSVAFIIESDNDTAKRLGATIHETRISHRQLDEKHTAVFDLFQYFMGNADFSTTGASDDRRCCHNTRLLDFNGDATALHLVPYDFDYSGLVYTNYSSPPTWLREEINSVRQRRFVGRCKSDPAHWEAAVARFVEHRGTIEALFEDERLSGSVRGATKRYIDEFYSVIQTPEKFERLILDRCRGKKG